MAESLRSEARRRGVTVYRVRVERARAEGLSRGVGVGHPGRGELSRSQLNAVMRRPEANQDRIDAYRQQIMAYARTARGESLNEAQVQRRADRLAFADLNQISAAELPARLSHPRRGTKGHAWGASRTLDELAAKATENDLIGNFENGTAEALLTEGTPAWVIWFYDEY